MKTALLTSYEKDASLMRLARLLNANGWDLLGSRGTAKHLSALGIPCRDVADIVGPPILGHRVVTLARKIYAGPLSRTDDAADMHELDRINVRPINLVYVTLYPLEEALKSAVSEEEVLEKTDIGGPTLLRAAAKGGRLAISDPSQIQAVEEWIMAGSKEADREPLRRQLAAAAERRVANYVDASARYWESKL